MDGEAPHLDLGITASSSPHICIWMVDALWQYSLPQEGLPGQDNQSVPEGSAGFW